MTILTVRSYPQGPRLWVCGQRIHHGATGAVLAAAVLSRRKLRGLALIGACLAIHDRADWRVWFRREGLMPASVTNRTQQALDTELSTCKTARIPTT